MEEVIFHLGIAADWEYDQDFLRIIEKKAQEASLRVKTIWPQDLEEAYVKLSHGEWRFHFLFDRASLSTPEFVKLQEAAEKQGTVIFDPISRMRWVSDKATMHLEFIAHGLVTPYTVIRSPYKEKPEIEAEAIDLTQLGLPFVLKPALTTGGGLGVIQEAFSLEDIQRARQEFPEDKYLAQRRIKPKIMAGRRFWFRVFYAWGLIQPTWWDDQTFFYSELKPEEIETFSLHDLFTIARKIHDLSQVHFFSTEIAQEDNGVLVVIDYINESCDMRLQSRCPDGVPDRIVENIALSLVSFIDKNK